MLKRYETMPRQETRELIILMGLIGNHSEHIFSTLVSESDVIEYLASRGYIMSKLVESCRNFNVPVPHFENLLGSTTRIVGLTESRIDPATGQWKQLNTGDGITTESDYWARFEMSSEDFERAIADQNPERFKNAVGSGLAAIEGFLNFQFLKRGHSPQSTEIRESIDWKFDNWVLRFTNQKFPKGDKSWGSFRRLRTLRNDEFQHPKSMWSGYNYTDLPKLFNDYRWGICRILLQLHKVFIVRCPSKVIRYSFYPNIYWDQ
jgi:hypothetical protein